MNRQLLIFAIAIFAAGCNEKIHGVTCETDEDCPGGKCDQGLCFDLADASVAYLDASLPDGGPQCLKDGDCPKCEKCSAGKCVFQSDGEDLKDECAALDCSAGNCDGAGKCGVKAADTPCRPANGGCDIAEVCNGVDSECPVDTFAPDTKECRAANGDCDVAELCTGASADCPEDKFQPPTKECRPNAGDCDVAEFCTGASADCPIDKFKDSSVGCRGTSGNDCDKAENCTGNSADCPADEKQPDGFVVVAEKCEASTHTPAQTCDGKGGLLAPPSDECAPYTCGATSCRAACDADADCTTFCDFDAHHCVAAPTKVDCTANPAALQTAISDDIVCPSPPTKRCYLEVTGTCRNITVKHRDVFIKRGTIDPSSTGGVMGAAVYVEEANSETTRLLLSEVTVQGALGNLSNARGLFVQGTGNPVGQPEVSIFFSTIGKPGAGNPSDGINASDSSLSVSSSNIQNNAGAGVSASNSSLSVSSSNIQNNAGAGVSSTDGDAAISASWIRDNTGVGLRITNSTNATVVNCVVAGNGTSPTIADDDAAGVRIDLPDASSSAFVHNTIIANGKPTKPRVGLKCITAKLPVVNSILWANIGTQVSGCGSDSNSHIEGSPSAFACGASATPTFTADYHLAAGSACADKVACIPSVTTDIDGERRPNGAGSTPCDVGADEYWP